MRPCDLCDLMSPVYYIISWINILLPTTTQKFIVALRKKLVEIVSARAFSQHALKPVKVKEAFAAGNRIYLLVSGRCYMVTHFTANFNIEVKRTHWFERSAFMI